jgi:hypothetical protein
MIKDLKDHVLTELPSVPGGVRAFWLRKPGTGIYSLLVSFLPSGHIALSGDLTIGGSHGCVSATGYGLDWWVSDLYEDYLATKFLEKRWQPQVAKRDLEQHFADAIRDGDQGFAEKWRMVLDALNGDDMGPDDLIRAMDEAGICDAWDYDIGVDYDSSAGWLAAAQQKFRELWLARTPVTP